MDSDFNIFINFSKLFKYLCKFHHNELNDDKLGREILQLARSPMPFEIDISECEFSDDMVVFVYSYSDNNANESYPHGSGAVSTIVYDRICEQFTDVKIEEGY